MNHQVRRVSACMLVLLALLAINLNWLQLVRGPALADHPANRRLLVAQYGIERGPIVVAGDQPIVRSEVTDGELRFLRVYEQPELYAHVTGHSSFIQGRTGIERAFNEQLTGTPTDVLAENLTDLIQGRDSRGNTVRLTLEPRVQEAARDALAGRPGAVVALEPTTGRMLASYANPTYDPNRLASHDAGEVIEAFDEYRLDAEEPLLDQATRVRIPPGSVFKIVVAAAALETGMLPSTAFDNTASYTAPESGAPIGNAGGGFCRTGTATVTLEVAFRRSCNTTFAELAVTLGTEAIVTQAQAMGFNRPIPYELPVASSVIPPEMDEAALAQSAIGQRDVRVTTLHAAMLAAMVANDGVAQRPWVVNDVLSPSARTVQGPAQGPWRESGFSEQVMSVRSAELLRDMMVDVVESGTGRPAAIGGIDVGGKTGTAEDPNVEGDIAWFVGFADDDVAVAVMVENADGGGGAVAAPIARDVMLAAIQ